MKRLPRHTASEAGRLFGGTGASRCARLLAGALCGLGVTLFPGLALLAVQLGLVAAWAFLMLSLLSATTRQP